MSDLRARYQAWERTRQRYRETDGTPDGPSSSEWQQSDDEAVDMLRDVMAALDVLAPLT